MIGLFTDRALGRALEQQMQLWDSDGAHPLHVSLLYVHSLGGGRYVGTVRFSADSRAVPAYYLLVFRWTNGQLRVVGSTTGIAGQTNSTARWSVTRSQHFIVYHSAYQLAGADRAVLPTLERERSLFEQKFGVSVAPTIAYYLYPEQRLISPMTGGLCGGSADEVGCADPYTRPPSIFTSEWPSYHEPVHVFELSIEPRPRGTLIYEAPLFISEGTAVALEDRQLDPRYSDYCSSNLAYVPLDSCAYQVVSGVSPIRLLSDAGFERGDVAVSYLVGGSFVKYLILKYGYRQFGRFYYTLAAQPKDRVQDYEAAARTVYRLSIERLLAQWRSSLCHSGC